MNPFEQYVTPSFGTEANMKAGLNNDGLLPSDANPVNPDPIIYTLDEVGPPPPPQLQSVGETTKLENPFAKYVSTPKETGNPFAKYAKPAPSPIEPPQERQLLQQVTSGAMLGPQFVGSVVPMVGTYLAYAAHRAAGANEDDALEAAKKTRTDLDPNELSKALADKLGIDQNWLYNKDVGKSLEEFDQYVMKPSADRYFGDEDKSIWKMLYQDLAYVAGTGAAIKGTGMAAGKALKRAPVDTKQFEDLGTTQAAKKAAAEAELLNIKNAEELKLKNQQKQEIISQWLRQENNSPMLPELEPGAADRGPVPVPEVPYAEPVNAGRYPILEETPGSERFMDQLGPDVDARNAAVNNPYIQNVQEFERAQAGPDIGAHSGMDFQVKPREVRELVPNTEGRDIARNYGNEYGPEIPKEPNQHIPYDEAIKTGRPEETVRKNIVPEYKPAIESNQPLTFEERLWYRGLSQSKTVKEAVSSLLQLKDSKVAQLASRFVDLIPSEAPLKILKEADMPAEGYAGLMINRRSGRAVELNLDARTGVHPSTLLHEAKHLITAHAHDIAQSARGRSEPQYRKFVEYSDEVDRIRQQTMIELSRLNMRDPVEYQATMAKYGVEDHQLRYALDDRVEFDPQISSLPSLQNLLKVLPDTTYKRSLWESMKQAWYDLFNIPTKERSLFDSFLKNEEKLPDLQMTSKEVTAMRDLFGFSSLESPLYKGLKDTDPSWTADEALRRNEGKDLTSNIVVRNQVTPNQLAPLNNNPMMRWFMAKMNQIRSTTNVRLNSYAQILKQPLKDISKETQLKVFKTLVDLQDESLKPIREAAEKGNTREQLLQQRGLKPGEETDFAIKILDVMQDIHRSDLASINKLGRTMDYQPMYFPRVHGGKFNVYIKDSNGQIVYAKGFESYKEAAIHEATAKNYLNQSGSSMKVEPVQRREGGAFADDFAALLAEHSVDMSFLGKALSNIEKRRELTPYNFEQQRRADRVGGYVGETIKSKSEKEALLQVMAWRLLASQKLENKAGILTDIKFPLYDDPTKLQDTPILRHVMANMINRELGIDISQMKGLDVPMQRLAEHASRYQHAIDHFIETKIRGTDLPEFRWEDPTVSADFAKELVKHFTYLTSMMKLTFNAPVLLTNFAQPSLIALDGMRTASLEGINHAYAWTAMMRTLGQVMVDQNGARKFMTQAKKEGWLDTKGHEEYTAVEQPNRSVYDKALQAPRDFIENTTNKAAVLYYYHFFKDARPDLTPEQLKAKVYEYARSFTGQYDNFAAPLVYDKAGTAGSAMTNFAKWHFNQLGRLMVDLNQLSKTKASVGRTAVPILMTGVMTALAAGAYGLPLVVEYEALRRLGMELGWWDIPPIYGIRDWHPFGSKDNLKDTIPHFDLYERGIFTALGNKLAEEMGAVSGPDVSGSMRHSAMFDTPTVAVQNLWDIVTKQLPYAYRGAKQYLGYGAGNSPKQAEDMVNSLPPAIKELVKDWYDYRKDTNLFAQPFKVNGKTMYLIKDPSSGLGLYNIDQTEKDYRGLGLRSMREARQAESITYMKWMERQDQKDIAEYAQGIMTGFNNPEIVNRNLLKIIELGGAEGVVHTINMLKTRLEEGQVDYLTHKFIQLSQEQDGVKAQRKYEEIAKKRRLAE